nr:hypothetical protein [Tanacetum cinerariifolium]
MGRDTVQLETAVNTISYEYLLEFTSEYGVPETLHHALPGPKDRIVDFPDEQSLLLGRREGIPNRRGLADDAPKDGMPVEGTYSIEAVRVLDTHRTHIQKQPEMLMCLVRISRRYYLGDELYLTFLHDDDRGGYGLVQFDSCPKSHKSEDWKSPPLKIVTTARRKEMPLPEVCTAIEEKKKKLSVKDRWQLH